MYTYIDANPKKVFVIAFFHNGVSPVFEGGLGQSSDGFKKISEFSANEKYKHDLMNILRVAKARLAAAKGKL